MTASLIRMITTAELFFKIAGRQFNVTEAKTLIRTSYYFGQGHPDIHIQLNIRGEPDLHFQHVARYANRAAHSMFPSFEEAADGISAALNCRAGESVARFLGYSGVDRVTVYSRSAIENAGRELVRRVAQGGGVQYASRPADVVILVLSILSDEVVLTTAYPATLSNVQLPWPPDKHDRVEVRENRHNRLTAQNFFYPVT